MNKKIRTICTGIFFVVIALTLNGCATAPGAAYTGLQPLTSETGDVYLYRKKAFVAVAQSFSTTLQGQQSGDLYNGSYLLFRLEPGSYDMAVQPGPFGVVSHYIVEVKAGERSFYQYDFPTGIGANMFFLGSSIQPRTQSRAEADLKDLTAAKLDLTAKTRIYRATGFAALEDVDAMPLKTSHGKEAYRSWLAQKPPRAFVIADNDKLVSTWSNNPADKTAPMDPLVRAMTRCTAQGYVNCKVYAIDNRVVWVPDANETKGDDGMPAVVAEAAPALPAVQAPPPAQITPIAQPQPQPQPPSAPPAPAPAEPVATTPPAMPRYSTSSVTPIFSQLLKADYPDGFNTISEQATSQHYRREAVPNGEDRLNWTRKFTITGVQGLADDASMTPTLFGEKIEEEIRQSCPASFSRKMLSEGNVNGYDQFIAVFSCGTAPATQGKASESMLLIVIKGEHDYYTVQSADRGAPSSAPVAINTGQWLNKRKNLGAVRLCTPATGETAPYTSCTGS
ncbi:DUF2846 domain-containing protein [Herbaspirillum rhizosphaerae]|uniref:DUF2846 domain-containing protein n=1 Tax=Herbaspirillum rhizosphaerae TaxID=346179 RepID=UPI00067B836D